MISPTMRCNLNCYGCYAWEYDKGEELETDLVHRILNEAREMGIYFITVSGGEPFIRRDLLDIFAAHDDLYFQVYTNGTFIDHSLATNPFPFRECPARHQRRGMGKRNG